MNSHAMEHKHNAQPVSKKDTEMHDPFLGEAMATDLSLCCMSLWLNNCSYQNPDPFNGGGGRLAESLVKMVHSAVDKGR